MVAQSQNPLGQAIGLYGHPLVDAPLFCTATRVRVRSPWTLVRAWWHFRRVRRASHAVPALKRAMFLVGGLRTFVIYSVWEGERGLLQFASLVDSHHDAVRMCFRSLGAAGGRPEIWSTQWRIWSVSNNLSWDGQDDWAHLLTKGDIAQSHDEPRAEARPGVEAGS